MKGLFSLPLKRAPASIVPRCSECKLYKGCHSPKIQVAGKGKMGILIVGEVPGREEDLQGRPFVGASGRVLQRSLRKCGVDLREDCWSTNALICHPLRNQHDKKAVDFCRPNLLNFIREREQDIKVVILLGARAVHSLIGHVWKEEVNEVKRWVGWRVPYQKGNYWICPTFNPAFVLYEEKNPLVGMYFDHHIERACKLTSKPWKSVPDYKKKVKVIYDSEEAAGYIHAFIDRGETVAWDLETNMLKPDSPHARIVSCAVSDGKTTVSYPWVGEAIEATGELLKSPVPKIAQNCKFEERWARKFFGRGVRNWDFDTMLATHTLDNRPGICSLKFEAFVLLGMESYDDHIKPYLKSSDGGGNSVNRIHEIELSELLLYGGLDALLEYKVARILKRRLSYEQ